jgi:hypothetical protein
VVSGEDEGEDAQDAMEGATRRTTPPRGWPRATFTPTLHTWACLTLYPCQAQTPKYDTM